jgi:hypothetical protein
MPADRPAAAERPRATPRQAPMSRGTEVHRFIEGRREDRGGPASPPQAPDPPPRPLLTRTAVPLTSESDGFAITASSAVSPETTSTRSP